MSQESHQRCPSCAFDHAEAVTGCARCGVVFARMRTGQAPPSPQPQSRIEVLAEYEPEPALHAWRLFGIGAIAALVVHFLAPLRFLLSPLVTLVHELGHAAAAWLLGCPAIPSFDFVHGGGVTHMQNFQLPLALLVGAALLALAWKLRRNPRALAVIGIVGALWLVTVSAEWRREVVIAAMGHGGELVIAALLLWMALSGHGWKMPEIERPLGAFAGWFVLFETLRFSKQLAGDPAFVASYREGKGGAMMHDLEVIALDLQIWTAIPLTIEQVAGWLLAATLATPVAVALLFVLRERAEIWTRSLLALER